MHLVIHSKLFLVIQQPSIIFSLSLSLASAFMCPHPSEVIVL